MKMKYLKVLLLGGLFILSQKVQAQIIYKDKMVYKVGQSVFSVKDLKKDFDGINTLGCMYGESLLLNIFNEEFNQKNAKYLQLSPEFDQAQKEFFNRLIQFSNLKVYAKSQPVVVDANIVKFLYLNAKENKCDRSVFKNSKELTDSFKELLKLEIL